MLVAVPSLMELRRQNVETRVWRETPVQVFPETRSLDKESKDCTINSPETLSLGVCSIKAVG